MHCPLEGFLRGSVVKNLPANSGDIGDMCSIPGWGRSPGEGNGNPFQYSCLGNPMDRGAWWTTVHGVAKRHDWGTEHTFACMCTHADTHTHTHTHGRMPSRLLGLPLQLSPLLLFHLHSLLQPWKYLSLLSLQQKAKNNCLGNFSWP